MNTKESVLNIIHICRKLLDGLIIFLFSSMFFVVILNVIMRFVFNSPIAISGELSRYLFVSITYLGAILAFRDNSHIGLDLIIENFSERAKKILHVIDRMCITVFLIVFSYVGFKMAVISIDTKSSAMFISMAIPYSVLPLSGISMLLELFIQASHIEKPQAGIQ